MSARRADLNLVLKPEEDSANGKALLKVKSPWPGVRVRRKCTGKSLLLKGVRPETILTGAKGAPE